MCFCAETSVLRELKKPIPPAHDCGYVRLRNAQIPEASQIALETAGKARDLTETERAVIHTETFFREMDRLVHDALQREERLGIR